MKTNESPKLKNSPNSRPESAFQLKEMNGGFQDAY